MTVAEVRMWGRTIGAVALADNSDVASFEYERLFAGSGIHVSPLAAVLTRVTCALPVNIEGRIKRRPN